MFESLDEGIKSAQGNGPRIGERVVRFVVIAVLSLLAFGAVYAGIVLFEY